jgi:signal transduction histidine kinase
LGLNPADFMTRMTSLRDYKPNSLQILMNEGVVASTEEGKLYLVEEKCREFLEKRM